MKEQKREYKFDYLRVLCCFLIVLLHFSSSYWDSVPINSGAFRVMTVYNSLTRIGVPIFIMLSGCFLLRKDMDELLGKNYCLRPLKMLATVYVWSFFYAFQGPAVELIKTGTVSAERMEKTLHDFIFGHYHMWFCFLIVGYYFLLPIAKKIAEDMRVLKLFLGLWIGLSFAFNCLTAWTGITLLQQYYGLYELNVINGFFGYFLLGYYLTKLSLSKAKLLVLYVAGIVSLLLTMLLTMVESSAKGIYADRWFGAGSPFVLAAAIAVFVLFCNIKESSNEKVNAIFVKLSSVSFFVYMFHVFILEKLNMIGITTTSFAPIAAVLILTLFAFAVSAIIGLLVKKIPFIGAVLTYNYKK